MEVNNPLVDGVAQIISEGVGDVRPPFVIAIKVLEHLGLAELRRCRGCAGEFLTGAAGKQTNAQFCSSQCKSTFHNHRRAVA